MTTLTINLGFHPLNSCHYVIANAESDFVTIINTKMPRYFIGPNDRKCNYPETKLAILLGMVLYSGILVTLQCYLNGLSYQPDVNLFLGVYIPNNCQQL